MAGSRPFDPSQLLTLSSGSRPVYALIGGGGSSLCNLYPFNSTNPDSLEFGAPFTGNLKVIAKCDDETGLAPELIAGRTKPFVPGEYNFYEIEAVALVGICDATFNGIIGNYYKDDILIQVNMGEPSAYAFKLSSYSGATLTTPIVISDTEILSFEVYGLDIADTGNSIYFLGDSASSYAYYRGSQSRLRIKTDLARLYTFSVPPELILDGKRHSIMLEFDANGCDFYFDGEFYSNANGAGGGFTLTKLGESTANGAMFNVAISNAASYTMLTYNTSSLNTGNGINVANPITYISPVTLEPSAYLEVL